MPMPASQKGVKHLQEILRQAANQEEDGEKKAEDEKANTLKEDTLGTKPGDSLVEKVAEEEGTEKDAGIVPLKGRTVEEALQASATALKERDRAKAKTAAMKRPGAALKGPKKRPGAAASSLDPAGGSESGLVPEQPKPKADEDIPQETEPVQQKPGQGRGGGTDEEKEAHELPKKRPGSNLPKKKEAKKKKKPSHPKKKSMASTEERQKLLDKIPQEVLETYAGGCSTCRHRPYCCASCWRKRGYK